MADASRRSEANTNDRQRATTATVAKTLEIGIALLFVAGTVTMLYGGSVPAYRTLAGGETADRTLAGVAERIERAVPPAARHASVDRRVPMPATIRGRGYRIVADGDRLRLVHPHPAISARLRLAVPARVERVTGSWHSTSQSRVRIETTDDGLAVRLLDGEADG